MGAGEEGVEGGIVGKGNEAIVVEIEGKAAAFGRFHAEAIAQLG